MSKNTWKIIIIFSAIMFVYSLITHQILLTILALILSVRAGKQNLFIEYDKKQEEKRQKLRNIMTERKNKQKKEKLDKRSV
jgi:1,4-dihydroxy-2-naphthoate octaprenyltransferase